MSESNIDIQEWQNKTVSGFIQEICKLNNIDTQQPDVAEYINWVLDNAEKKCEKPKQKVLVSDLPKSEYGNPLSQYDGINGDQREVVFLGEKQHPLYGEVDFLRTALTFVNNKYHVAALLPKIINGETKQRYDNTRALMIATKDMSIDGFFHELCSKNKIDETSDTVKNTIVAIKSFVARKQPDFDLENGNISELTVAEELYDKRVGILCDKLNALPNEEKLLFAKAVNQAISKHKKQDCQIVDENNPYFNPETIADGYRDYQFYNRLIGLISAIRDNTSREAASFLYSVPHNITGSYDSRLPINVETLINAKSTPRQKAEVNFLCDSFRTFLLEEWKQLPKAFDGSVFADVLSEQEGFQVQVDKNLQDALYKLKTNGIGSKKGDDDIYRGRERYKNNRPKADSKQQKPQTLDELVQLMPLNNDKEQLVLNALKKAKITDLNELSKRMAALSHSETTGWKQIKGIIEKALKGDEQLTADCMKAINQNCPKEQNLRR